MTTSTATITEFLLARIAADEAAARTDLEDPSWGWTYDYDGGEVVSIFTPPRVMAECEAKRRIVERHESLTSHEDRPCCADIADLASVYADHPDYRQEWAL